MTGTQDPEDDRIAALLRGLPREIPPPASVERQTIAALRRRGFLQQARPLWWRAAAVASIAVVSFGAGWLHGARRPSVQQEPRYMLLLYAGGSEAKAPEESIVEEYRQWARALRGTARAVSGARLDDREGTLVGGPAGSAPADRARLQGYFIIQAADDREAVAIAERHPHVRRGGHIIIRRIDPT